MASNLQSYHLLRINDLTYSFTTEAGIIYECSFVSYSEYFFEFPEIASKVFAFNMDRKNSTFKPKGTDSRIADTVVKIVGDFLNSQINAVVYVCDPSDGKGAARAKTFKSWFNYYEHDSYQIQQVNACLEVGKEKLHTALLVHRKNKLKNKFVEAYLSLTDGDK